jgi:hypothetical protein
MTQRLRKDRTVLGVFVVIFMMIGAVSLFATYASPLDVAEIPEITPVTDEQLDVSDDGQVDIQDLYTIRQNIGSEGTAEQGDLDNNGQIDLLDVSIFASEYVAQNNQ